MTETEKAIETFKRSCPIMKDALSIVKGIRTEPAYKYSILIQYHLSFESNFEQFKQNYPNIRHIQQHLGYDDDTWNRIVGGSLDIPLSDYKRTLNYLKTYRPDTIKEG